MKIVTVVGARPQFVKAAPVSRALRRGHIEILVHTGQHYDDVLSAVFFEELGIPAPDHHLNAGSGPHGAQTGRMMTGIEGVLEAERPDRVLVYGDTNSTLAGALVAAKLGIPVAHVEAGLRSFNRAMPEEINRIVADRLSAYLFCPSDSAAANLAAEGIRDGVHVIGDVMAEALAEAVERAKGRSDVLGRLGLAEGGFLLATVHRAENTDDPVRLAGILAALDELGSGGGPGPVLLPLHPRTRKALEASDLVPGKGVLPIEPVGYLDMVRLERAAAMILTDSGGVQKEAYWLGIPCVTLRDETEWVETVAAGWNTLAGAGRERIVEAARSFRAPSSRPPLYAGEHPSASIAALLTR